MRTGTDALRSLQRFTWKVLGDAWEVRFWGVEGGSFPRLPDGSPGPFARVAAITQLDGSGPSHTTDYVRTFTIHAYPSPGADPESALMGAEAVEQQLAAAFNEGIVYSDPLVPPDGLAWARAPGQGSLAAGDYVYAVTSVNGSGESVASEPLATTVATDGTLVHVGWTAVQGATSYRLYRGPDADSLVLLAEVASAVYSDDGLTVPGIVTPPGTSTAVVQVRSAKWRVPLYDYDGVPLDGLDSVSNKRGPSDFMRVSACPINRIVDPEDDRFLIVTAQPRVGWRRIGSVPSGAQVVEDVRLRMIVS